MLAIPEILGAVAASQGNLFYCILENYQAMYEV